MEVGFPELPTRRVKEWSPIDRMLAAKKGSKSNSPKPRQVCELPPLTQPSPEPARPPPATADGHTQTATWAALVAEASLPERQRREALQGELKCLKALLLQREEETRAAEAKASAGVSQVEALKAELERLQNELAAVLADREQERLKWAQQELQWRSSASEADEKGRRGREDLEHLRNELSASQSEAEVLRRRLLALQDERNKLLDENNALAEKLNLLWQGKEDEQAVLMARVELLERKLNERSRS